MIGIQSKYTFFIFAIDVYDINTFNIHHVYQFYIDLFTVIAELHPINLYTFDPQRTVQQLPYADAVKVTTSVEDGKSLGTIFRWEKYPCHWSR